MQRQVSPRPNCTFMVRKVEEVESCPFTRRYSAFSVHNCPAFTRSFSVRPISRSPATFSLLQGSFFQFALQTLVSIWSQLASTHKAYERGFAENTSAAKGTLASINFGYLCLQSVGSFPIEAKRRAASAWRSVLDIALAAAGYYTRQLGTRQVH